MIISLFKLKVLCDRYDQRYGRFPESSLEGEAVFEFVEEALKTEKDEFKQLLGEAYDAGFNETYTRGPIADKAMRTRTINKLLKKLA